MLSLWETPPRSAAADDGGPTIRSPDRKETARLVKMLAHERPIWKRGVVRIAGVDEVGVGPLAGPVVAGAVILEPHAVIPGVDDSKKLSPRRREELARAIRERAIAIAIGMATVEEIDVLNILQASRLAMQRAVLALRPPAEHLLVDARSVPGVDVPQAGIIHGDALSQSIAAASIVAKVYRDDLMAELATLYPGYGFELHSGYPTPAHLKALRYLGPCAIHRRSFAPVREAAGEVARKKPRKRQPAQVPGA
jgi:ribonuclease HII